MQRLLSQVTAREPATHTISGRCHCGNLSFELRTRTAPEDIAARACDCRFCRMHAAVSWSDPNGTALIRISHEPHLQKYRFALRTADFYICTTCGAYLGAVLSEGERSWSTVNLRLTDLSVEAGVDDSA
ncbi:MAG TPA: aldehyde-activating protein [Gammaproteobacteria bacterium]|nr:aldehyde-activating protein [Gammaproteobacteria bacterium]